MVLKLPKNLLKINLTINNKIIVFDYYNYFVNKNDITYLPTEPLVLDDTGADKY